MPTINITVADKKATTVGAPVIVCDNSDYTIAVTFDDEWSGATAKTARFVYVVDGERVFTDVPFTGDTVGVPVLSNVGEVLVGFYTDDLRTTVGALIPCRRSIRSGTGEPYKPTPSQYDQIMAMINGLRGGSFEFINEITTTEDADVVTLTLDSSGEVFELDAAVLYAQVAAGSAAGTVNTQFKVSASESIASTTISTAISTSKRHWRAQLVNFHGMWDLRQTGSIAASTISAVSANQKFIGLAEQSIQNVSIIRTGSVMLPAGSIFTLYGIRR